LAGTPHRGHTCPRRQARGDGCPKAGASQATTTHYKLCRPLRRPRRRSDKHTHAKDALARRRKKEGQGRRLAGARRTTGACRNRFPHARATGTSSPPHDVQ
jgi:hypothetical protein